MIDLLVVLTPISLVDSVSMIPFGLLALAVLLSGSRPYAGAVAFVAGIFCSYLPAGLLLVLGLGPLFDRVSRWLAHWWSNPGTADMILGIVVGLLLVFVGYRIAVARPKKATEKADNISEGATPGQAFMLGAGATIVGLWGALPYFAAADQIMKADLPAMQATLAIVYYNLIFILPLVVLLLIRAVAGERAAGLFDAVNRIFARWGKRVLSAALIVIGLVVLADSIGWLIGRPLLPV